MYQGMQALRETLRDQDKILKVLIDRAQRTYGEYRQHLDDCNSCRLDPTDAVKAIHEVAECVWEVMRDAYTNGPDFVYTDAKKQRALRQALRLLNFASRVVSELLADTERQFEHHKYQNHWRAKERTAQAALSIAERMASLTSPGPETYNHPQYKKWHEIAARCHRRIGSIWFDAARECDLRAKLPLAERPR